MPFLPSRLLLLCLMALVPAVILAVALPGMIQVVVLVPCALVAVFLFQGFRVPPPDSLELRRELPLALSVGESARVILHLRNRSNRLVRVALADGCPVALGPIEEVLEAELAPFGEAKLSYRVKPLMRGVHSFLAVDLRLHHPGSFAEHPLQLDLGGQARVHPNLRNLGRYDLRARRDLLQLGGARRTRILGRQGDFERLREFVTGDDVRHLDWKATARLQRPITRVFQAERSQNLLILVDGTRLMAARAGVLTKMDYAVNAALMLAHVGLARGDRVGVAIFDHSLRAYLPPRAGHAQFGRILDLLFDQQATHSFPRYREAARQLVRDNRRRSLLVWITDLVDGEQGVELLSALRALRRRHLSLVVALADPQLAVLASQRPRDRAALFAGVAAAEVLDEREALMRKLRAEGAFLVERSPEQIGPAVIDQYLDLKQRGRL